MNNYFPRNLTNLPIFIQQQFVRRKCVGCEVDWQWGIRDQARIGKVTVTWSGITFSPCCKKLGVDTPWLTNPPPKKYCCFGSFSVKTAYWPLQGGKQKGRRRQRADPLSGGGSHGNRWASSLLWRIWNQSSTQIFIKMTKRPQCVPKTGASKARGDWVASFFHLMPETCGHPDPDLVAFRTKLRPGPFTILLGYFFTWIPSTKTFLSFFQLYMNDIWIHYEFWIICSRNR